MITINLGLPYWLENVLSGASLYKIPLAAMSAVSLACAITVLIFVRINGVPKKPPTPKDHWSFGFICCGYPHEDEDDPTIN
jgi:hypothetical protein